MVTTEIAAPSIIVGSKVQLSTSKTGITYTVWSISDSGAFAELALPGPNGGAIVAHTSVLALRPVK